MAVSGRVARAVEGIMRRQHGLISRAQAVRVGLTRSQIRHRLRSGRWVRDLHGVYRVAGHPVTTAQRALAVDLATGADAIAGGRTAAELWGLQHVAPARRVEAVTARRLRIAGIRVRRTAALAREDRASIRGVPVTALPRTLIDLAADLPPPVLERVLDDALLRRGLSIERLHRRLLALGAQGRRGAGVLRRLVDARRCGGEACESELELRILQLIRGAGLAEPEPQHRVEVNGRRYRIDLAYPAQRIAIEVDGWDAHGGRRAFDGDRLRGNRLVMDGWRLVRFTFHTPPAEAIATLRALGASTRGAEGAGAA